MFDLNLISAVMSYSPATGQFVHKTNGPNRRAGALAGSVNKVSGYVEVGVMGKKIYGHRLAWLMSYGAMPSGQVDHINGDRSDNRIANLRAADAVLNGQNKRTPNRNNTSGFLGVTFCTSTSRWCAQITVGSTNKKIGRFDTPELAYAAYLSAKRALHPGCTI